MESTTLVGSISQHVLTQTLCRDIKWGPRIASVREVNHDVSKTSACENLKCLSCGTLSEAYGRIPTVFNM